MSDIHGELGISIVITVYNEAEHIAELLESLVSQEPPIEIVIVDSMSTDGTQEVIRRYQQRYGFIKNIRARSSRGEGRNIGVSNATYDYIAFTDGDAIAHPFWIQKMREKFKEGYDIIAGRTIQMGYTPFEKLGRAELYFEGYEVTYPSVNLGYKKSMFQEAGGFDPKFITAEDIDLNIRAVMNGGKIKYCDECIIFHRTRTSLSSFVQQAFWNGFGRKQLTYKHKNVWSHFKFSTILQRDQIGIWQVIRGVFAVMGYMACKLFGDDFIRHYRKERVKKISRDVS